MMLSQTSTASKYRSPLDWWRIASIEAPALEITLGNSSLSREIP
jgi:hypothetical protein